MRESTFTNAICKAESKQISKDFAYCEDAVSRQAAIDATWFEPSYTDPLNVLTEVRDRLKDLPSVQPEKRTQERTETHTCDLISRQAAIDAIYHHLPSVSRTRARTMLHEVPSAQPELLRGEES